MSCEDSFTAEKSVFLSCWCVLTLLSILDKNVVNHLDFILDDNELKQDLFTPGSNIPIKGRDSLDIDEHLVVIPLAWNFFDEIKSNVNEIRGNKSTQYVQYFPRVMFVV